MIISVDLKAKGIKPSYYPVEVIGTLSIAKTVKIKDEYMPEGSYSMAAKISTGNYRVNPSIEIKNLNFSYNGKDQILSIPTFSVNPGEKVFVYGNSGSGKSTLLNIISGVLRANNGTLNLLGQDIRSLSTSKRDRFRGDHIGFVFKVLI